MKLSKVLIPYLFCCPLIFWINNHAFSQNYIFAQLSGAPMNTTGWNLQGDARVDNITGTADSEMVICSTHGGTGAVFCNQAINLALCRKWIAEFDFRMYDGDGADGIAFCFLDVPPVGFVKGGGLGVPNNANGLKVCFDTWNNCIPYDPSTVHQDMPKIEIRWGRGYDDNSDPFKSIMGECLNYAPTRTNYDGKISFIRSPDYNHAKITYDSGIIQVFVNEVLYLTANQQFNYSGYLGFTASTGGYNDNHSVKNVIIYTQMPPSFAGKSQSFCPYDTIQIGGPSHPSYIYSWSPVTGLNDPTASAPNLHIPGDSVNAELHTYVVKTSFSTSPGCASTDSIMIKVFPNPNIHFITPEICLNDAIAQFYDSTITNDSETLPFIYQWSFGDPNAGTGNPNGSTTKDPSHSYSAASNYLLTLAVTNAKGCGDSLTQVFTVNGAVPKSSFNLKNVTAVCSNQPVQISNESSVDFGSIAKLQIYWGDSTLVSYTDDHPYPGKLYSHRYPDPVLTNVSNYSIRMISFSGITCEDESEQQIAVQPGPHVQFNVIPSVCEYDSAFKIIQASEITNLPGVFSFYGNGITPEGIFNPQISRPGKFVLLYKYISGNGCVDSAFQTITVLAPPAVFVGNDTSVVVNQPLQLQALPDNTNQDSFIWSPVTGLNNPNIANPVSILGSTIDSIIYIVNAIDTVGCTGQASIKVKVFKTAPDIFVPNAFTPGKSTNRIFKPIPVGIVSIQYFRIYNRWGQLLFNTSRIGDGWDGTVSGKPQLMGSYIWMVRGTTYAGASIIKQGAMILIR